jgi:non-specific serine/threonine protein kinase
MIGKTISHYRILEKLGEGGMGVVYRAHDTKLDRDVALKFLPANLIASPEELARFEQEAKTVSALNHPNIAGIYDVDEVEGQRYLVLEYIPGGTLKSRLKELKSEDKVFSISGVFDYGLQMAEALAHAHRHGIIHRDVKTENMMLTDEGRVKLADFGLAKPRGSVQLTKTGSTLGTAAYMSPEQVRGEEIDHRSDIFSLGVVLYELVTGRLPFQGEFEAALSYSILNENPRSVRSLRPDAPASLERIIDRCLEKERDRRYQGAEEIVSDLRKAQRELGPAIGTHRTRRRLPLIVGMGIVAVAIVTLAYFLFFHKAPTSREKSIAVLPFVDMSPQGDQEYFCDGMTEELINRLSNIRDLRVPARTSAFMFKGKTEDIREIGSKLNVQTVLEGSVRKAGNELRITAQLINVADGYHLWSETFDRELEDVFAIQDEISSAIVNALQLKLTSQEKQRISEHPIDNVRAYECYLKAVRQISRFDEKSLDSAFVYLQTGIDIMGDNAELYSGMAFAYWQYANMGIGQEDYLKRAEEYARKALALKPDLASALSMLGTLCLYEDYPKSLHNRFRYFEKALTADPNDTRNLSNLAFAYQSVGKPSEASAIVEKLERLDPLNPWWHVVRGRGYQCDCQFGPALEQSRMYYRADSTSPLAQMYYSWMLVYNGKRDEALAVIDRMGRESAGNVQVVFSLLLKYALLNDQESGLRLMTPEFQKTCRRDYEWSYWVAGRLSLLGAKEEALDWLENAVHHGFIAYPFMQCDPFLDNIRSEERFKKLMAWAKNEWENFEVPE